MQVDEPHIPEPGPPKEGFWGWLASLFPRQPKIERKDQISASEQADKEAAQDETASPGVAGMAPDQVLGAQASTAGRPTVGPYARPGDNITPSQSSEKALYTDEKSKPNTMGEELPPLLPVPPSVKKTARHE